MEITQRVVTLAIGIAITILTTLNVLNIKSRMVILGIGLACVGIHLMKDKK